MFWPQPGRVVVGAAVGGDGCAEGRPVLSNDSEAGGELSAESRADADGGWPHFDLGWADRAGGEVEYGAGRLGEGDALAFGA